MAWRQLRAHACMPACARGCAPRLQAFLHSDTVRRAFTEKENLLSALTVLKKICDHPALLSARAATSVIAGGNR